jgi:glycosyltransferase involved in cell wall biosynthesis
MTSLLQPTAAKKVVAEGPGLAGVTLRAARSFPSEPRRRLTVCHLLHTLHVGGAEVLAARLARQGQKSCRSIFVCLDERGTLGEELRSEGFVVEVLGRRSGVDWRCATRLARLLRREKVDLVHAHQYTPFFYGLMARLLYRRPPLLFTEHGRHFPDYPRPKRILANRLLLERRDRVVGVGQAVRQALIRNEGIPADRVGVIYNGIDTTAFASPAASDRQAARIEMGVEADAFVILLVARLDYLKDHATAVRTVKRLAQEQPKARLVLVGEGPEHAKIQELVEQEQLGAQVRFLGLRKNVAQLLGGADVFLLTSISEGIPLTVIEAMATGIPVVATRVGGVPEVIEDGQTGWLAPSGDDRALAGHLLCLANDVQLRMDMGRRGQERARRMFSESQMHARYHSLYREMVRA